MNNKIIFDLEIFVNFTLVGLLDISTQKVLSLTEPDFGKLHDYLERTQPLLIGFNSQHYDGRILNYILCNYDKTDHLSQEVKEFSDFIIMDAQPELKDYYSNYWWKSPHIDLKNILGGRICPSLKKLAYRLHLPELETLPIDPAKVLTEEDKTNITRYNIVDLKNTQHLFNHCQPLLELRQTLTDIFKVDCRSLSDAQIAEKILGGNRFANKFDARHARPMSVVTKEDSYHFDNEKLQSFFIDLMNTSIQFEEIYDVGKGKKTFKRWFVPSPKNDKSSSVSQKEILRNEKVDFLKTTYEKVSSEKPAEMDFLKTQNERILAITLPTKLPCEFKFGGMHSIHDKPKRGRFAYEVDVASFYPHLILKHNIYPAHLGVNFTRQYRDILHRRLKFKEEGNKIGADSLKIILNSTFGKFSEWFSKLRDPLCGVSVCLNGELSILRLIDLCEQNLIDVLLVNTDGIITAQNPARVVEQWQAEMEMPLETKPIDVYFIKDSNNLILKFEDGSLKIKGAAFNYEQSISKQTNFPIISKAIVNQLMNDIGMEETIKSEKDIHQFLGAYAKGPSIQQVKLATSIDDPGTPLPNMVRFFLGQNPKPQNPKMNIYRRNAKNWTRIADTENAVILNKISCFPPNLDYNSYLTKAKAKLTKLLK